MDNGYVILGIVALLFLSMYGYSYYSVAREKMRENKKKKMELEENELRRERRLKHQAIIDEKVRKFNERKQKIQEELSLLEKMKEKQQAG
ncbi:hypothetical protein KFZ70_00660 [Tamlana fucoidanivorans]|uniref:Uncharacterized protein n=1 Tax=Allotamlana fucoidanivorans TaxID=2583814 RepID=A0A5C4SKW4_9FLAO|nr:hypothetical protein [Tamlana fucoidanivorans]TNJ44526.1 hypothetical protein FGF67_07725 [Tamlana fucoidanivorans]